jgi:urease alpha subunit
MVGDPLRVGARAAEEFGASRAGMLRLPEVPAAPVVMNMTSPFAVGAHHVRDTLSSAVQIIRRAYHMDPAVPRDVDAARRRRRSTVAVKESLRVLRNQLSLLNHQVGAHLDLKDVDLDCLES